MASECANWDYTTTKRFLDLCIAEKNICNFNQRGPTRLGWLHIHEALQREFGNRFTKKQLQNKLTGLRAPYNNWLKLQNHTGLGRDRTTGGIAADDSFWSNNDGGASSDAQNLGRPPPFFEELSTLFGRTPQDRGTLMSAGGARSSTPTTGSQDMPEDPLRDSSIAGRSSKRSYRDVEVDGPPKKRTASLEDCVRDIKDSIVKRLERRLTPKQQEMDRVRQLLKDDGIPEGSELYYRALYLCDKSNTRRSFIMMETAEARVGWINFMWEHK